MNPITLTPWRASSSPEFRLSVQLNHARALLFTALQSVRGDIAPKPSPETNLLMPLYREIAGAMLRLDHPLWKWDIGITPMDFARLINHQAALVTSFFAPSHVHMSLNAMLTHATFTIPGWPHSLTFDVPHYNRSWTRAKVEAYLASLTRGTEDFALRWRVYASDAPDATTLDTLFFDDYAADHDNIGESFTFSVETQGRITRLAREDVKLLYLQYIKLPRPIGMSTDHFKTVDDIKRLPALPPLAPVPLPPSLRELDTLSILETIPEGATGPINCTRTTTTTYKLGEHGLERVEVVEHHPSRDPGLVGGAQPLTLSDIPPLAPAPAPRRPKLRRAQAPEEDKENEEQPGAPRSARQQAPPAVRRQARTKRCRECVVHPVRCPSATSVEDTSTARVRFRAKKDRPSAFQPVKVRAPLPKARLPPLAFVFATDAKAEEAGPSPPTPPTPPLPIGAPPPPALAVARGDICDTATLVLLPDEEPPLTRVLRAMSQAVSANPELTDCPPSPTLATYIRISRESEVEDDDDLPEPAKKKK